MSRIGLSIDDCSSGSCCSDLSESETSFSLWNEDSDEIPPSIPSRGITMSLDDGTPQQEDMDCNGRLSMSLPNIEFDGTPLPTGSAYRSRIRHRLEELQRQSAVADDDADVECPTVVTRQPHSRLRFYFALISFCLVTLSLNSTNTPSQSIPTEFRREEVVFPLHQQLRRTEKNAARPELPKYYFPKVDPSNAEAAAGVHKAAEGGTEGKSIRRANIAMARSNGESRPVFGVQRESDRGEVERFVLQDIDLHDHYQKQQGLSLTSWLAGISLICILLETGYKEYKRCKTSLEEERRL